MLHDSAIRPSSMRMGPKPLTPMSVLVGSMPMGLPSRAPVAVQWIATGSPSAFVVDGFDPLVRFVRQGIYCPWVRRLVWMYVFVFGSWLAHVCLKNLHGESDGRPRKDDDEAHSRRPGEQEE